MAGFSDKVQVRYEELESIAQRLARCSDTANSLRMRYAQQMDVLKSGGWIGEGANKFYQETDYLMMPAFARLEDILSESAGVLRKVSGKFNDADQQASRLFRADGGGLAAGAGAAGAIGGGAFSGTSGNGGGGGTSGAFGSRPSSRASDKIITTIAQDGLNDLVTNPKVIDKFARVMAGGGGAGAVDDLVNLGRKLKIENGLAMGAKLLGGAGGGVIDFLFLPPEKKNAEEFGVQVASGVIQGAITLNPIGATVMVANGVVQLAGSGITLGIEKLGETFNFDTTETVKTLDSVMTEIDLDTRIDAAVQGVVNITKGVLEFLF